MVNLNCLGTLLLPMIKMHSRKDSHNVDGNTERTDASTHHFQRKRRIPWRYYAIDCLQYASLAFLAGGMFGAVRGFRAMKYSSISNEKINLLREKIFMGSKLSEQLVSNTKSQKRPLEKRHLIIASTIQSGFKYGINSALLIGMFCLIDTSLRARFAWHNVPIVKEWNHALNLALLSTDMMESISDERHLTSHNILHKMVSGSVVGAIIATFVSINTHRKLLKMIGYGIPLGMAVAACSSPLLIPLQNFLTVSNLQSWYKKERLRLEQIDKGTQIRDNDQVHGMINDEAIFLEELDRVRNKLDQIAANRKESDTS